MIPPYHNPNEPPLGWFDAVFALFVVGLILWALL